MSVFAYRAPTDEDKAHLAVLQVGFIALESAIIAFRESGSGLLELTAAADGLQFLILEHVPESHERQVALERWDRAGDAVMRPWGDGGVQWQKVMDALRECRMWANAGIVAPAGEPS